MERDVGGGARATVVQCDPGSCVSHVLPGAIAGHAGVEVADHLSQSVDPPHSLSGSRVGLTP